MTAFNGIQLLLKNLARQHLDITKSTRSSKTYMCIRNYHGIVSLAYFFLFGNHDKLNCRTIYVIREYVIHGSKSPRKSTGIDETQGEGGHPHQAESPFHEQRPP